MSFLFWAFLAGSAAVAFPIVFHLIRRTPRGRQQFSSLMFLRPSPPRLTRRSRLDHLLLLLLRAAVILLLALAFMRPFWRAAADLSIDGVRGRRIAILLDTSASMRRGNLWRQATAEVENVLGDLEPVDDVALYTFDDHVQPVVAFDEPGGIQRDRKAVLIRSRLAELRPSWSHTDLGTALVSVGEALDVASDVQQSDAALQVVVISDVQQGSRLEMLQAYQWPPHVHVALHPVSAEDSSNATVQLLGGDEGDASTGPRVRVRNAADSGTDQFYVSWAGKEVTPSESGTVAIYVPPGQSRVLRVPRDAASLAADRLTLNGDKDEFDNTYYVVPVRQQETRLAYIGSDSADDPQGLRYYLDRALGETAQRKIAVTAYGPTATLDLLTGELPSLVVVADAVSDQQRDSIAKYLTAGGTVLAVLQSQSVALSLAGLWEGAEVDRQQPEPQQRSADTQYVMLGEIDFTHPLFTPFASARYNDFTKIRFWRHQSVDIREDSSARVVAWFDNQDPALWEQPVGKGKLVVLASGWHPDDSQLGLSTKFVPLLAGIMELSSEGGLSSPSYMVGDIVRLPANSASTRRVVRKPDGALFEIPSEAAVFDATDQPGIYELNIDGTPQSFAVNLAASESDTAAMQVEQLEQFGVKIGTQPSRAEEFERLRQLRDGELESRQKIWKWLVVAALCVLGLEMLIAGRRMRQASLALGEAT